MAGKRCESCRENVASDELAMCLSDEHLCCPECVAICQACTRAVDGEGDPADAWKRGESDAA
jgi:hypothetical protein